MTKKMEDLIVIKIGGNEAEDPNYLAAFAEVLRQVSAPKVLVHGGGKSVSQLQEKLGEVPQFVDGQRYTTPQTLDIVEMVLCGTANKRLVRALVAAGHNALGISGMDAEILLCNTVEELGLVGKPRSVNIHAIAAIIDAGFIPVIAPIGIDRQGQHLNVNADLAAAAIALEMKAEELVLLTNVPGIVLDGTVAKRLEPRQVRAAIGTGEIRGGMIPKVNAALEAAEQNIKVRICNLAGLSDGGTTIYAEDFAIDRGYSGARRAVRPSNI